MRLLELFAGAGGASLGLARAGFHHLASVDADEAACATLRAWGRPGVHALASDHEAIERAMWASVEDEAWEIAADIVSGEPDEDCDPDAWGLEREAVAIGLAGRLARPLALWASPPCQIHSRSNSRARDLAYDGWPDVLSAVDRWRPRVVMVENVQAAWGIAQAWISDLAVRGYKVAAGILDAADYGAPQTRRRVIIIAALDFSPHLPTPTHGPLRKPYATLGGALPLLAAERAAALPVDAGGLHRSASGEVVYPATGHGRAASEPWRLDQPAPTVMTTEVKGTRASASSGWTFNGGPDRAADAAFLATGRRRLTVEECATLQGFPPGYPFTGTTDQRYRQAGNAVPPCLAEAVGRSVMEAVQP